jgi:hypothetical protein
MRKLCGSERMACPAPRCCPTHTSTDSPVAKGSLPSAQPLPVMATHFCSFFWELHQIFCGTSVFQVIEDKKLTVMCLSIYTHKSPQTHKSCPKKPGLSSSNFSPEVIFRQKEQREKHDMKAKPTE